MPDSSTTKTITFKRKDGKEVTFTSTGVRKAKRDAAKAELAAAAPPAKKAKKGSAE